MPRPNSGPRLVPFKSPGSKTAFWYIVWYEGGQKRRESTGIKVASGRDSQQAQEYLKEWLALRAPRPTGANHSFEFLISDALDLYGVHKAETMAAPERAGYAMTPLLGFWEGKVVSDVRAESCRQYRDHRSAEGVKDSTVRRELGVLSAALNWCALDGYLLEVPKVWRPKSAPPKDRWLTRAEVAAIIRAARKNPHSRHHLPLFVLIGIYTCTRKTAILGLQRQPNTTGGWVDLENDLIYRKSTSAAATNKRQTPVPIPPRLRRFLEGECPFVVSLHGKPLKDIKRAFSTACKDAGIEGVTPHTLRHTGITWLVQRGVPLWEVAGFAGCSVEMIERTYGHHAPDYLRGAKNALNRG
ncbi:MAG: site-specific integrase [Alphaproteobacteria bacterium]|nr:MAG: site-specific integrase [Alphaproteobacteria bacterium]